MALGMSHRGTWTSPGCFALASGGTIFLDEIAEFIPALQVKLLRVLQERTYEPLGAARSEITDARVLVATNKDLAGWGRTSLFR
jgi:transcriptional regulator with GAF, ATPase, and Fis domain